jgi:alpha-1,3-fucosyltransferase
MFKRFRQKYIVLCLVFTSFLVWYKYRLPYTENGFDYTFQLSGFPKINIKTETSNGLSSVNKSCNPFYSDKSQYSVLIDGENYPKHIALRENRLLNFDCMNQDKTPKLILYWTPFYDRADYYYGLGQSQPFLKWKCPAYNCEVTNNKNRLNESHLVVVSMINQNEMGQLPESKSRPEHQRWIFYLIESPIHTQSFETYNNYFNMSVTYKFESDFASHYSYESHYVWEENKDFNENFDYSAGKTDFAAILVSNCGGSSQRLQYVHEMKKHVNVSIFGNCGQQCMKKFDNGSDGDCKEIISTKYKFFLAFENSLCSQYITEKFFIILRYNIIPVVLGAGDYSQYIPKSGYINVFDFKTVKDLTDHLIYLDNNKTAYNSYFKWRKHVVKKTDGVFAASICEMCIRLNIDSHLPFEKKTLTDLNAFWSRQDCETFASVDDMLKAKYNLNSVKP